MTGLSLLQCANSEVAASAQGPCNNQDWWENPFAIAQSHKPGHTWLAEPLVAAHRAGQHAVVGGCQSAQLSVRDMRSVASALVCLHNSMRLSLT